MAKMKFIVEIDGVRHKMVKSKDTDPCGNCSLEELCGVKIGSPCYGACDYFVLETKAK